jgi:hypothetical protein
MMTTDEVIHTYTSGWMKKPILSVDFDGVIHSYSSGWKGPTIIPDPPVPGALDFLERATEHFRVAIYSTRSNSPEGIEAMQIWLRDETKKLHVDTHWIGLIEWPTQKPPAFVTLDDRAICFDGTWPSIQRLFNFKTWNKP